MSQSLSRILLHLVFSTKKREPWINELIQPTLHAYLAGACRAVGSEAFRVGGTEDHIHVACTLSRTLTVGNLFEEIKKSSSAWLKQKDGIPSCFAWQSGYGVFSIGESQLPTLLRYIDNQKEHHRTRSFKEEYLEFLKRYGVNHDERYLWD
jgi:REP element-mobilizing transposase RayT